MTRALPLAVRIRRYFKNAELFWAVEPKSYPVIRNHAAIEKTIVFDRPKGFFAYLSFLKQLRAEKFDIVLDLQRHFKSGVTSRATGAKRRIGFSRANSKEFNWLFNNEFIPAVDNFSPKILHYQLFGDALRLPALNPLEFGLKPSRDEVTEMEKRLVSYLGQAGLELANAQTRLALIVGSSWPSRFWSAEHYRELIEKMFKRWKLVSFIVGGPSEEEFAKQIFSNVSTLPAVNLVGKLKLEELATFFSSVGYAFGSDSGPMHIAAAVGIPVISIWGATSPARSAPYNSEKYVIKSDLKCSPCYKRECPGLGMACMLELCPDIVLAQFEKLIEKDERGKNANERN